MKLPLRWKWMALFILLLLFLLVVQGYLYYSFKISLISATLFSLVLTIPLAYLFVKILVGPILQMTDAAMELASDSSDRESYLYSDDEIGKLSKAIRDIGVRLRTKIEEISKEKEYLQTILRGMGEGVLVVDGRGRILTVNDAFRELLSISGDVSGKTSLEVVLNSEMEEAIRRVLHDGKGRAFELTLPSPGGRTFEVNVVRIYSSPGEMGKEERVRGAIAVFHDITRLKELEQIRQDFVANVSHELRTPLTTIKGYAETLLGGALKEEVALPFVQIIKKHTDRLTKIVEDLLMLSKIESKGFDLKSEPLSLSDLIDDVLDFVKDGAGKKNVTISREEVPLSLVVQADRNYLEHVFVNLLDNGIKYTHEGGKISISASEKDQGEVQISIRDDGIGIPREDLPRIFERFYRVDKGRSQELGGTGLGLSIVKHIVQAYGGKVWAESQPGKGSTFHLTLPKTPKGHDLPQ
jgi:two-component system, OmpR family, phosphate regulon sensor histidine kinase PhoR